MQTWRTWRTRIAISVLLLIVLAPFAMTLGARSLADVPANPPSAALPPLPEPGPDAIPSLDGLVDSLPLVARDLPDEESLLAVDSFDQATLLDTQGGAEMFRDAWSALTVAPVFDDEMTQLASMLMPDRPRDEYGYMTWKAPEGTLGNRLAIVMPALQADPRNADRLNNAAIGLFLYEVELLYGPQSFGGECGVRGSEHFLNGALMLLQETDRAFPSNRTVLLNLGFLTSLAGDVGEATRLVSRVVAQDPADWTARLLLGNLIMRQAGASGALDAAIATLTPLVTGEGTEALGHAALGDAWLAAALADRDQAPFLAKVRARQALTEYDLALALTADPGVYAGRSAALDLLGAPEDAIAALERALDHAPDSTSLRIGISLLYQRVDDIPRMREHAQLATAASTDDWNPRISDLRYAPIRDLRSNDPIDPGYLSFSYGSDKDIVPLYAASCGPRGGGYIVSLSLFPAPEPWVTRAERFDLAPWAASMLAMSSSVLLGDAVNAASDWDTWNQWARQFPSLVQVRLQMDLQRRTVISAADLVAGSETAEQGWSFAVGQLEDAGRYAQASEICERFEGTACAGINAYLAGDYERASANLSTVAETAIRDYTNNETGWFNLDALTILQAGDAAREAGRLPDARDLYTIVTLREDRSSLFAAIGHIRLADLALDSGEPTDAISHLDDAQYVIGSQKYQSELDSSDYAPLAMQAEQVAHNNRGIARLWAAMPAGGGPPDCTKNEELCRGALEDFAIALDADPYNPVYLLNMGWVSRLLDDSAAARAYLTEATTIDPSLYPSYNDLGVLAASDGDWETAHAALLDAAAANPDYDLALWNLGVLEMGRGGIGLLSGQAYLARSINHSSTFEDDGGTPSFRMDERIYRVAFDAPDGNGFSFSRASSLAAGFLGSLSFLYAIAQTFKNLLPDKLIELMWMRKTRLLDRGAGALRLHAPGLALLVPQLLNRLRADPQWGALRSFASRLSGLRPPARWRGPLAWIATITVLVSVTVWPVWRDDAYARPSQVVLALFAVLSALVVHEAGHHLAARWKRARISYTQWPLGVALAPVLMPFGLNCGPFMGQRVEGVDKAKAWWVYVSGPAANLAAAFVMYLLFRAEPLPMLRLLAVVHVAAAAYALLPFQPLDGAHLNAHRPAVASVMGFTVTLASVLFVVGIL